MHGEGAEECLRKVQRMEGYASTNAPVKLLQRAILTEVKAAPDISYDALAVKLSEGRSTVKEDRSPGRGSRGKRQSSLLQPARDHCCRVPGPITPGVPTTISAHGRERRL